MDHPAVSKFTTHLKKSLVAANAIAVECQQPEIGTEHLLYGLLLQKGSIALELLHKQGLRADVVREFLIKTQAPSIPPQTVSASVGLDFSYGLREVLVKATLVASQFGHKYVGTEHALTELAQLKIDERLQQVWTRFGVQPDHIRRQLIQVLKSTAKYPDLTDMIDPHETKSGERSGNPALEYFCTNLTDPAVQERIDPVIGRNEEIERLIHILSRRTKNNPVLIGDPGVGKTAIVEGLAKRIVLQEVPEILLSKRVYSLDLGLVIAGTMYRGEFEGRLKQIVDEIRKDPNIIVFIDELHTLMGTGGANGTLDAANLLKPALAKGMIRCIGATTLEEYRKHIESDAALERRFQPIIVDEPTPEETIAVLEGLRVNYERFHRVHITDDAIQTAVRLSQRYLQEKFLPDKAIDLIDEAASKVKVKRKPSAVTQDIRRLTKKLAELEQKKYALANQEQFSAAVQLKVHELELEQEIERLKAEELKAQQIPEGKITGREIAEVISRQTSIPVQELVREEKTKLLNLERALRSKIIGQEEAITALAQFIRRSRAGLNSPDRPIGSFMFLGPSGVGKTELAKVLAAEIFDDPNALIRIDMSEFNESFQASRLIGSPAGYVGYKDGGKLTDQVRRKPYAVVLFDEIEKAHPDIFNLLLQVLEDGLLTDATGKRVNFKNTLIILTSNIGIEELNRVAALGFESERTQADVATEQFERIRERLLASLRDSFRPEFLNRLDKVIVFKPLNQTDLERIVELQLKDLEQRLASHHVKIEPAPSVIRYIAKKGFEPEEGARAIRRIIQEEIENPLADRLLAGTLRRRTTVKLTKGHHSIVLRS